MWWILVLLGCGTPSPCDGTTEPLETWTRWSEHRFPTEGDGGVCWEGRDSLGLAYLEPDADVIRARWRSWAAETGWELAEEGQEEKHGTTTEWWLHDDGRMTEVEIEGVRGKTYVHLKARNAERPPTSAQAQAATSLLEALSQVEEEPTGACEALEGSAPLVSLDDLQHHLGSSSPAHRGLGLPSETSMDVLWGPRTAESAPRRRAHTEMLQDPSIVVAYAIEAMEEPTVGEVVRPRLGASANQRMLPSHAFVPGRVEGSAVVYDVAARRIACRATFEAKNKPGVSTTTKPGLGEDEKKRALVRSARWELAQQAEANLRVALSSAAPAVELRGVPKP